MRLPFYINARGKLVEGARWDQIIDRMRLQIMQAEDEAIFAALDAAARNYPTDSGNNDI